MPTCGPVAIAYRLLMMIDQLILINISRDPEQLPANPITDYENINLSKVSLKSAIDQILKS